MSVTHVVVSVPLALAALAHIVSPTANAKTWAGTGMPGSSATAPLRQTLVFLTYPTR
jgi:hypothetical protein